MEYGRLGKNESRDSSRRSLTDDIPGTATSSRPPRRCCNAKVLLISASVLLLISGIVAGLALGLTGRARSEPEIRNKPTQAISKACSLTPHPSICINSLMQFPGAMGASDSDLIHISVNVTLHRFGRALDVAAEINNIPMDIHSRAAYEDCLELLEDSVELLAKSLSSISSEKNSVGGNGRGGDTQDVLTWLSSALTNQDTCEDGLTGTKTNVRDQMFTRLKDLSELVSNSLALFAAGGGNDFRGIPINNRRLLQHPENNHLHDDDDDDNIVLQNKENHDEFSNWLSKRDNNDVVQEASDDHSEFPTWLSKGDRKLLSMDLTAQQANIIVSKDGNGTVKTISAAIKKVPEYSQTRTVIFVKAGRYEETILKLGRKKTNVMFVGEGKGKTVITGGKSIFDNITTFHTATFAATGAGFIAKDITFENYAGPGKHQAVALRVGSDHAVIYRCSIIGYQDTLYVHSNRQFFRECDIYGTVDFIFGNAAVVFQNCGLYPRKPLPNQKNTITAQNRKDPNQNTGISIHACKIAPTADLAAANGSFGTYLGRPWKLYSRTVYMQTYISEIVHPEGWLPWNTTFALDTLYYGEYMNYGPGAGTSKRVKWPGYHNLSRADATKFTVAQFILGSTWLPSTGVAFMAGLQV